MKGFTFPYGHKDVFVETTRQNKTEGLASEILRAMVNIGIDIPDNPDVRQMLLYFIRKAECEIHTLSDGKQYYEIHGDNFGGRGSFVDDGNTIIIRL